MNEARRQEIKDRVAAGEERLAAREDASLLDSAGERAAQVRDRLTAFAREHPLTTVAAGLAVGVLISGLFPRSPTRRAGVKAAGIAAVGAETAMGFLNEALGAAGHAADDAGRAVSGARRAGRYRLEDLSDSIIDALSRLKRNVAHSADDASASARIARRESEKRLRRAFLRTR